jgi:hypothetical protein
MCRQVNSTYLSIFNFQYSISILFRSHLLSGAAHPAMKKLPLSFFSLLLLLSAWGLSSCWKLRGHYGGRQSFEAVSRSIQPAAIARRRQDGPGATPGP